MIGLTNPIEFEMLCAALERLQKQNESLSSNPRHGCRFFCAGSTSRAGVGSPSMSLPHTILSKEWLASRIIIVPSGCWEWNMGRGRFNYGVTCVLYKPMQAHRAAWIIYNGPIPTGLCVLHKCDNPPCCNPEHLFLGTKGVNNSDRASKGRSASTESLQNRAAKISPSDVLNIREAFKSGGATQTALAKQYGLVPSAVSRICTGSNWKNIK